MHWIDLALFFLLLMGGVLGARSGLLWQVARIAIFAFALYSCIHYHAFAAEFLQEHFDGFSINTAWMLAYVFAFLGVCLAGFTLTWVLEYFLRATNLKPLDRLLGALFGMLKAGLICGGLLIGVQLYGSYKTQVLVNESLLAPPLLQGMSWALSSIPEKIRSDLDGAIERARRQGPDTTNREDSPNRPLPPADASTPRPKPPTWGPLAR